MLEKFKRVATSPISKRCEMLIGSTESLLEYDYGRVDQQRSVQWFDGTWENSLRQKFSIQDGVITMGRIRQLILDEGSHFRLDKDTWRMEKDADYIEWTNGKQKVKWR